MKSAVLSVLFVSMIIVGQVITQASDPVVIDYTCSMDGTIKIQTANLAGYSRIAVGPYGEDTGNLKIGQTDNDTSDCTVGVELIPQPTLVLSKCNLTEPVIVYLMNDTNPGIIGGKNFHEYELKCSIPDEGLNMSVTAASLNINNIVSVTPETHSYSVSLQMSITPQIAGIGDKLNISIIIKQTASQDLFILPTKCIAKSSGTLLLLMDNGATKDSNVLGEFNVGTKWIASADMFAFRFFDSDKVQMECDVTVCKTQKCVSGTFTGINSRRRRSAKEDISGETFEVSASFQIGDKETDNQDSGQCNVRWNPTVVISLLLLTLTAFIRNN